MPTHFDRILDRYVEVWCPCQIADGLRVFETIVLPLMVMYLVVLETTELLVRRNYVDLEFNLSKFKPYTT